MARGFRITIALAVGLALGGCSRSVARTGEAVLEPSALCITSGSARALDEDVLAVEDPVFRGVVPAATEPPVEVAFVYEGPTQEGEPLASGELRRAIALKLRARDSCNVLYVVWKIEPVAELAVLVKANPGMELPEACGDRGYQRVKAEFSAQVPPIHVGEEHVLGAKLEEKVLEVLVDGESAWRGVLPDEAFSFDGPVGIRTDNGRFRFRLAGAHGPIGSVATTCEAHATR